MKKVIIITLLIVSCLIAAFSFALTSNKDQNYYYAFDEKILLLPKEKVFILRYFDGFDKTSEEMFIKQISPEISLKWRNNEIAEISLPSENLKETLKTSLESRKDISTIQQLYNLQNGLEIIIFDEILVKFKSDIVKQQQDEINKKFKTLVIENCEIFQILKVSKGDDALEIANQYYETGLVEFSKPNFLSNFKPFQVIPNDPYFGNQISCHNVGQTFNDGHSGTNDADIDAPEAWEITTGSNNIIIAVIDQGVTNDHPDLPNTRQVRLAGSDLVDGDADPSPVGNNNHGNACAGVIGATMNNNKGIAGIAPDCRIMPIRIDYNTSSTSDFANAIRFAVDNGADIISNSWGLGDQYSQPPYSPNIYPEVVSAIQYAAYSGRGNRGCIVLFAVGNTADHTVNSNGFISFPANVTVAGVLSVGASDRDSSGKL